MTWPNRNRFSVKHRQNRKYRQQVSNIKISSGFWLIKEGNNIYDIGYTVSFKNVQAITFQNGDFKFSQVATTPQPLDFDGLS